MAWIGRGLGAGQRRLCRGGPAWLTVAGAMLTMAAAGLAAVAAWLVACAAGALGPPGILLEAAALKTMLSVRDLGGAARAVARGLESGDLEAARRTVGRDLVSRPTAALDAGHVASAAVESTAENLTDSVLAPLLFYVVLGLPGAAAYRVINTADAMIGYRHGALEHFGKGAARLDDVLNLIPARLAALALVAAAALAGADGRRAWTMMRRDHARTASPNAGWTMAAMAGALGVRLEKPGYYVLGEGRLPGVVDIEAGVRTMRWATGLLAAALAGLSFMHPG